MTNTARSANDWVVQLYDDLRMLAHAQLRRERTAHTLSTTGLVNEVWLRLSQQRTGAPLARQEFFGAASTTMRRILVDSARSHLRAKRGGGATSVSLDDVADVLSHEEAEELVALDDALERLQRLSPRGAEVVQYRFFAGLTLDETAALLGVSVKTVQREWILARAWLRKEVAGDLGRLAPVD